MSFKMNNKLIIAVVAVVVVIAVLAGVLVFTGLGKYLFSKKAATVNGDPIYMSEIDKQMDRISKQHKTKEQEDAFKKQKAAIEKQILDLLIEEKLYLQQADDMKISVTDKQVEAEVNATIKRFPSKTEFNKALKDAGMTMDDLTQYTRTRMIQEKVNEKVVGKTIKVTDAQAKEYYDKNTAQFTDPEKVKVSHILVASEEEANAVIAEINGGKDFAAAASEKSTDPASKTNGGDLGYVQKGVMAAEFETAAFALEPGTMTETPVKTSFGWHVIKVFEKTPAAQRTYEESKASIEQMLQSQQESAKIKSWLDGVKKKATIKKYL
jgi:parvulin-like peptidyl-prolyl isomerase